MENIWLQKLKDLVEDREESLSLAKEETKILINGYLEKYTHTFRFGKLCVRDLDHTSFLIILETEDAYLEICTFGLIKDDTMQKGVLLAEPRIPNGVIAINWDNRIRIAALDRVFFHELFIEKSTCLLIRLFDKFKKDEARANKSTEIIKKHS